MNFFLKKTSLKVFEIVLLFLLIPGHSFSRSSFHISKWYEKIITHPLENYYVSSVTCTGSSSEKSSTMFIPYSETEKIDSIVVSFSDWENKIRRLDSFAINNQSLYGQIFYDNLRAYQFPVPATPFFQYKYVKTSKEIILLSALTLNPFFSCDTAEYEIRVPKGFMLRSKFCNIDSTMDTKIDSTIQREFVLYHIISVNRHSDKTDEMDKRNSFPLFLKTMPSLKTIIVSQTQNPEEYLNDWYMNILEKEPSLTKRNFASIIKEIGQEADTDKLVRNIFHFVQAKIKYIDIENGLNAFVPRDPNFVLENKQGDCKDMAFLIYSILKGCGIKSNLALAASITHSFDVDFPSVASANHVICTFRKNNSWVFLDATDNTCEYGLPSNQIQGKHIFIIGKNQGRYVYVQPVDASDNESKFDVSFHINTTIDEGKFSYEFKHSSAGFYKSLLQNSNRSDYNLIIHEILKSLSDGCEHEIISTLLTDSTILFSGNVKITRKVLNSYSSQTHLPVDFMAYLDWLPKAYKITDPMICYSTLNKKSRLSFSFENTVHLKNERTKKFNENGFECTITVTQVDSKNIDVNSSVIYNEVTIKGDQLAAYRKMILFITSELTKGIIYE